MAAKRGVVATADAAQAGDLAARGDAVRLDDSASAGKAPRTERGRKTLRAILDAAAIEFGERGFHEASVSGITRRAGVALGSFYTYFDSKDEIFQALVRYMSEQLRDHVTPLEWPAQAQLISEISVVSLF